MAEALPASAVLPSKAPAPKVKKQDELPKTALPLTDNSLRVLARRYLKKTEDSLPAETPEDLFWRVSRNIAQADRFYDPRADLEKTAKEFYNVISRLDFLPNSPTLMNAGRDLQQLSACFVLPIGDSMEEIFETLKHAALIHKSGGGTGFAFSRLRSKGARVKTTHGIASGPVSFMKVFNAATEQIKQGGTRRGANMGILRVDHPDIMEFITSKADHKEITNFNISVAVTDEFMEAVKNGTEYSLYEPRTKEVVGKIDAREVFESMVRNAWNNGDPGVVFIDRINRLNPTRHISEIEATNPCGEQPLPPYDSCNLGSINLGNFVSADKSIQWDRLRTTVQTTTHFLDNVLDMNNYPIPEIAKMSKSNRRIGLGVMGFADMLIRMEIPYNSTEGLSLGEKVMEFIHTEAVKTSQELARKRGNFPHYPGSQYEKEGKPMRNSTVTTVAPTGTISMIADCSSGIEPLFSIVYTKTVMDGTNLLYVHPLFEAIAKKEGWYSEELMKKISERASCQGIDEVPEKWQKVFVCTHDITPEQHVEIQSLFQKWVDSAISKTVNFPHEASVDDVRNVYMLAYDKGCKGVTIYRDGSRDEQVLHTERTAKSRTETLPATLDLPLVVKPRSRPDVMHGFTYKVPTSYGNLYITINEDDHGPFEVFGQIGKSGSFFAAQLEAVCRLISLALRSGVEIDSVIRQIKGIRDPQPIWYDGEMILSLSDAIAQVLEKHVRKGAEQASLLETQKKEMIAELTKSPTIAAATNGNGHALTNGNGHAALSAAPKISIANMGMAPACPDCGGMMELGEGCLKCRLCGYAKCG
ncbi:MAG TPA: vitamin B12-dependent ribonucleotide reductase [Patescibacteria group bacterium]|nr:vitamin B12-dependent ribonucleotide reductase [Patescibacteria group bacterium]